MCDAQQQYHLHDINNIVWPATQNIRICMALPTKTLPVWNVEYETHIKYHNTCIVVVFGCGHHQHPFHIWIIQHFWLEIKHGCWMLLRWLGCVAHINILLRVVQCSLQFSCTQAGRLHWTPFSKVTYHFTGKRAVAAKRWRRCCDTHSNVWQDAMQMTIKERMQVLLVEKELANMQTFDASVCGRRICCICPCHGCCYWTKHIFH